MMGGKVKKMVPARGLLVFLVFFVGVESAHRSTKTMRVVESWKYLDFAYPSMEARRLAIEAKSFIPGHLVPIDVDVYTRGGLNQTGTIFVTVPRFQEGVPVTIGYVTNQTGTNGSPLIGPYPNWEMQTPGGDCTGITSVYRIAIDVCNRIWILDTGKLVDNQVCPPQLLVYSLETNILLSRHIFPKDLYTDASLFITPVADIRGSCRDTFVYIADVNGFSLIVYDHAHSRSWKIVNKLFYPYPEYGTFNIDNETFDLMDGLFGLALGPIKRDGDRTLYFHSLASRVESYAPTSIIRNSSIFRDNVESSPRSFESFKRERSSQAGAEAMDSDGVLFYGLMGDLSIGCWNSKDYPEFGGKNLEILVTNRQTLQFASGMKIINPKGNREQLWTLTSSFQRVMTGTLTPNVTNFRILAAYVDELVRDTKCQVSRGNIRNNRHTSGIRHIPTFGSHRQSPDDFLLF